MQNKIKILEKMFLECPRGLQRQILDWWEPGIGDIISIKNDSGRYEVYTITSMDAYNIGIAIKYNKRKIEQIAFNKSMPHFRDRIKKLEIIPHLSLWQLWNFIEFKFKGFLTVDITKDYRDEEDKLPYYMVSIRRFCKVEMSYIISKSLITSKDMLESLWMFLINYHKGEKR